MESKKIEGLSRSDFEDIFRLVHDDKQQFKYALIRYDGGVCMINSQQIYETFRDSTVAPGTVTIQYEEIVKYELDATGNRMKDDKGEFKLIKTGKWGWSVIKAVPASQLIAESELRTELSLLKTKELTAVLNAQNDFDRALLAAQQNTEVTDDMRKKLQDQLAATYNMK